MVYPKAKSAKRAKKLAERHIRKIIVRHIRKKIAKKLTGHRL